VIVICNGMLRSGSTLQYNVATMVLEASGRLDRVGFIGGFAKPKVRARLEAMRDAPRRSIVKTHEPPLPRDFYNDRVRVLFSYRDVRDVAASIKKKWAFGFDNILADIDAMIAIERQIRELPHALVQPYELLRTDIALAARQIALSLDVALAEAEAAVIAEALSLSSMRERLDRRARNPLVRVLTRVAGRFRVDGKTQMHDDHISASEGRDGDWVNQFNLEETRELNSRYLGWLSAHGYEAA
jgi:hypothetical protein